jgi:hypothetical protein
MLRLANGAIQRLNTASFPHVAISRLSSGMQDPQWVPARSFAPISAGLLHPPAIASTERRFQRSRYIDGRQSFTRDTLEVLTRRP